ncbi:MAG: hypothetical protein V7K97_26450 [Nostoc sp.]
MTSSISLSVMRATLSPITLSMNRDAKSSAINKIPDNFYEVGDLSFYE